ncbi:MAG TPA: helix-hairpin-helix domain-containing protein, partial [Gaiellaceae bacterium]
MDNAAVAARLDEYAALLELAGAQYYSYRAYRRAADLIRATPAPIDELVRTGRVRELRGIGAGIETRLRELVETGELAELRELERTVSPELAAYGRLLGIGAQRAVDIGRALGIRTVEELRSAAAEGRLREVPGIGPKTEAKIVAAIERGTVQPSRVVLLNRARALVERIAEEVGGVAAGDPRRWKDACTWLAVAAHSGDLASVPEIVSLVAPNVGITVEGIPVELHVAPAESFGTA